MTAADRPDIEALLKRELEYYREQARRCEVALAALRGEVKIELSQPKVVGWAAAIDDLFESLDPEVELSIDDVFQRLGEMGLPTHEEQARSTIQTTLARKAGKTIERAGIGLYKKMSPTGKMVVALAVTADKTEEESVGSDSSS